MLTEAVGQLHAARVSIIGHLRYGDRISQAKDEDSIKGLEGYISTLKMVIDDKEKGIGRSRRRAITALFSI